MKLNEPRVSFIVVSLLMVGILGIFIALIKPNPVVIEQQLGANDDSPRQNLLANTNVRLTKARVPDQAGGYYENVGIQIAGQAFTKYERDQMMTQLKARILNKEPLTKSFDGSITDSSLFSSLIGNFNEECGPIISTEPNQVFPIPFEDLLDIVEAGC